MAVPWQQHKIHAAFQLLLDAYDYAREAKTSEWDFAVEIRQLRWVGMNDNDCRWMTLMGYAEHRLESTLLKDSVRTFYKAGPLKFDDRSCFVLTAKGVKAARAADGEITGSAARRDTENVFGAVARGPAATVESEDRLNGDVVPNWDGDRHELRVYGRLVKRFRRPAPYQEAILAAFQEEEWPPCIADPLSPGPEIDAKRRLNDVVKSLNRHQRTPLLRFMGDGSGEGVMWRLAEEMDHHLNLLGAPLVGRPI